MRKIWNYEDAIGPFTEPGFKRKHSLMKVLFIVPYPTEGPSNRFRIEQYLPYLKEKGITYTLSPFYNRFMYKNLHKSGYYAKKALFLIVFLSRRLYDVLRCHTYDIVFIHREAYPFNGYVFELLFKVFARHMIYDYDDSLFLRKPKKISKTIQLSDSIISGNQFLKKYALQYNSNVFVLSTCIDTARYKPKIKPLENATVVIGWMGTFFTSIYLELLKEAYAYLSSKYKNVRFMIVGGNFSDTQLPVIRREWSLQSEVSDLQEFDIGVMPLFDDEWARGKCSFKIIQYMAVGIPAVASNVGMNREIISHGKDGFLVEDRGEWIQKLSLLIEDAELRRRMGECGRRKIEQAYSLEANKMAFVDILKKTNGKIIES